MTHCPKCASLLLQEVLAERNTNALSANIYLSRCPMCGFYTDPLMEANRALPVRPKERDLRPGFYRLSLKEFRSGKSLGGSVKKKYTGSLFKKKGFLDGVCSMPRSILSKKT